MIQLFDYYNLKIYFRKIDKTPLHVYGGVYENNELLKESLLILKFENGLFQKMVKMEIASKVCLDEIDENRMRLIILNHLDAVVKRWIDYYIFDKPINQEIITSRIEDQLFS